MKAIEVNTIITGIRSKVDGSLGITMGTPELSPEEKAEFMRLQGINLLVLLTPLDEQKVEKYKIDRVLERKTPSERLRGTLWRLWEQAGEQGDFNDYYRKQMEKFIDAVKERLN